MLIIGWQSSGDIDIGFDPCAMPFVGSWISCRRIKYLQYQQMKATREEIKTVEGLKAADTLAKEQPDQSR